MLLQGVLHTLPVAVIFFFNPAAGPAADPSAGSAPSETAVASLTAKVAELATALSWGRKELAEASAELATSKARLASLEAAHADECAARERLQAAGASELAKMSAKLATTEASLASLAAERAAREQRAVGPSAFFSLQSAASVAAQKAAYKVESDKMWASTDAIIASLARGGADRLDEDMRRLRL